MILATFCLRSVCYAVNSVLKPLLWELFIWGELARLGGVAHLDEMIFILRSYGIFYISSIKKFVMSLGWPTFASLYGQFLSHLGEIPAKPSEIPPRQAFDGRLDHFSYKRIIFLYEFIIPLCANFTKWSNTLKQFVGKLPANCFSVFHHFVGLALKGLKMAGSNPGEPAHLTGAAHLHRSNPLEMISACCLFQQLKWILKFIQTNTRNNPLY